MRTLSLFLALSLAAPALAETPAAPMFAEQPTAEQLLGVLDDNLTFESRTTTITMTVVNSRRTREFTMRTFARGEDEASIEYLSPTRDAGTKMLRRGEELWMYIPNIERTQKISGHMLRQGMMGSDMSYEDMMASTSWQDQYTASVTGADEVGGRKCWKVELLAKDDAVTYPKRVTCVDAETGIPTRQDLYALSGMLLKTWTMEEIKTFEGGRRFPTKMTVSYKLKEGTYTTIEMTDIVFGVELEDEIFSQRWLERR